MDVSDFLEKAKRIHGDRYEYPNIVTKNDIKYKDKIEILCKEHGIFIQCVGNHLSGQNCPICGKKKRNKQYDVEEFIRRANLIHNNRYDYSKVNYIDTKTKVCIIDPINGEFWQTPNAHLSGHGCKDSKFILQQKFIEKAKSVHGDKYDYSKVEYTSSEEKVTIICPIHGEFEQTPCSHAEGRGCPYCGGTRKLTTEDFITKAKKVHGDKYDYSKVEYINSKIKVCIICPKHGEFWQTPCGHLSGKGCYICGREISSSKQIMTTEEFINISRQVHGDKYDYSRCNYNGYEEKVIIGCPIHGFYKQTPDSHIHSGGCPKCGSTLSKNEDEIISFLETKLKEPIEQRNRTILHNKEIDIYIPSKKIGIEYHGLYWHSDKHLRIHKNYHLNKTLLAENNGVRLIQIFEDEYVNKKEIVLNKLLHILQYKDESKEKINARECYVKEIEKKDALIFLEKYHIQGFVRGTIHLGCFFKGKLIGVMSFTKEQKNTNKWELTRFATDYNYICRGVGGKLFKYFISNYDPLEIKSFADRRWSTLENSLYEKIGFKFEKFLKPDYRYYNEKINRYERIHKFNFRKKILQKKYNLCIEDTETTMAKQLGYYKIYDCGLIKYIWKK